MGRGGRRGGGRSSGGRSRGASRGGFGRTRSHFHAGRRARPRDPVIRHGGRPKRNVIVYVTLLTVAYVIVPAIPLFVSIGSRIMRAERPFYLYAIFAGTLLFMAFVTFLVFRSLLRHYKREAEKEESMLDAGIGSVEDPALKELEEKYKNPN